MSLTVNTFGCKETIEFLYKNNCLPQDESIEERIRFFSFRYLTSLGEGREFYSFLSIDGKVIGVAHVGHYSMNARHEKNWSISFLSIDKDYRSMGYSKLLIDAVFKEAKNLGLDISASSYTVLGKEYLQKQCNQYAKQYGVVFYDKTDEDSLIDADWMYKIIDGKKLHKSECGDWEN